MNFVFLSPHFPPNYYRFAVALKNHGVNVLGLADEPYDSLRPELKSSLTEYFRLNSMHNYDELLRALGVRRSLPELLAEPGGPSPHLPTMPVA